MIWHSVTVGILGGMGPAATAEFLKELTEMTPANRDQDNITTVTLSDCRIPDRTEAIISGHDNVTDRLRTDVDYLASWGADLLAVPCNTAHKFLLPIRSQLAVPLVSIVSSTLNTVKRGLLAERKRRWQAGESVHGPTEFARYDCWLACTKGTLLSGVYQQEAVTQGIRLRIPPEPVFSDFMDVIGLVKAGKVGAAGKRWAQVAQGLRAVDNIPIVLACTELPLASEEAARQVGPSYPIEKEISSIRTLAAAVVRACGYIPRNVPIGRDFVMSA